MLPVLFKMILSRQSDCRPECIGYLGTERGYRVGVAKKQPAVPHCVRLWLNDSINRQFCRLPQEIFQGAPARLPFADTLGSTRPLLPFLCKLITQIINTEEELVPGLALEWSQVRSVRQRGKRLLPPPLPWQDQSDHRHNGVAPPLLHRA